MPDVKYETDTQRMDCTGLDLNHPVDEIAPTKFPRLKNVRVTTMGEITSRGGLAHIAEVVPGQTNVHSCRRLNDPRNGTYTRVVGAGTHLAYGTVAFTDADSGYSGDPLALTPWRPEASPDPWMVVADRLKMRKIKVDGTLHPIGFAAPPQAPAVAISAPTYKIVQDFDTVADFTAGGDAVAVPPSSVGRVDGGLVSILHIVYDTGATGWATVAPSNFDGINAGMQIDFPGATPDLRKVVQETHPGGVTTGIGSIVYDVGTTGLCSIILATPVLQVEVNGLVRNTTVGPENARVLSVTSGPAGVTSLRVSTTNTWAATNTILLLASFRVYLDNTHAAAEVLAAAGVRATITFVTGQGTLTDTIALDLSNIATGLATQPEDFMHISARVDRPDRITELKIMLDVDSALNDFTHNFYSKTFRADDLTPSIRNLQPLLAARQQVIQRTIIDSPIKPPSDIPANFNQLDRTGQIESLQALGYDFDQASQLVVSGAAAAQAELVTGIPDPTGQFGTDVSTQIGRGDVQWSEMFFAVGDLLRVGTDTSRSLKDVAAIRILATVTGTVVLDLDSWWIGGGYGPDTNSVTSIPYLYRFRARHPSTNVASNFSPALRSGVAPKRQSVTVSPTQYALPSGMSGAASEFVLDIERFGGEISEWHYAGTVPNASVPVFVDKLADDTVAGNPTLGNANYQPWPIIDIPRTGTTGVVAGTSVTDSATNFNLLWAPGSRILIDSLPYTIYRVISTSRLELVENAGSLGAVTWRIDEPTLLGQPLPVCWVHDDTLFGLGDTTNPGRLYYTRRNSETTWLSGYLDITTPSDPLMNGISHNARNYVFSSEAMYEVLATSNADDPYRCQLLPGGQGLFSRWAITINDATSPYIYFLAKDGINRTNGGPAQSITDRDLYPLFPAEGHGVTVNEVLAPTITNLTQAELRLEYYAGYLYFDYVSGAERRTLVYAQMIDGWFYDSYTPGIVFHYGEEGANVHSLLCGGPNGRLYEFSGTSDNGTAIACNVRTGSRDQGAPRMQKLYGDVMVDLNPNSTPITITPATDNFTVSYAPVVSSAAARLQVTIPLGTSWKTGRNVAMDFAWSAGALPSTLLIWEPRWTFESASTAAMSWETSPTSLGYENFKHLGFYRITHVSSQDLELIVTVDGVVQPAIVIPASGGVYTMTVGRFPVHKAKLFKFRIADRTQDQDFRLDTRDSYIEVKEWASEGIYVQMRVFSDFSFVEG